MNLTRLLFRAARASANARGRAPGPGVPADCQKAIGRTSGRILRRLWR